MLQFARFKKGTWEIYYELLLIKDKSAFERVWIRNFRINVNRIKYLIDDKTYSEEFNKNTVYLECKIRAKLNKGRL